LLTIIKNDKLLLIIGAYMILVALIIKEEKLLILKNNNYWELPGGKKELLENDSQALRRILFSCLGIDMLVDKYIGTARFEYKGELMEIKAYLVPSFMGDIILYDNQQTLWINSHDFESYELPDLDKEIIRLL
jgi:hypothetical protein